MPEPNRTPTPSVILASGLAAASLAALMGAGCSMPAQEGLPPTHLDPAGEVAVDHGRCGACHPSGTRGNGFSVALDAAIMESLSPTEFAMPAPPADATVTEGLDVEAPTGEGE